MKSVNLVEMAQNGELLKTGAKPKLPIKMAGLNESNLDVYRIPLELLFFNNENGRIASAISRLDREISPAYEFEDPEYNQLIENMISEDNLAALKQTKNSINKSGQKVFGYVLADGRVIDGNRRFSALRQLENESGTTHYFEAVVLPITYDSKASRAEIKRLELAIQLGTEEREAYDPVDLSVDIYQTVVVNKLMSEQDYSREANIRIRELTNRILAVELMHDFLSFINAKTHAYHIIKDSKLYNPIAELAKKLNSQFPQKGPRYEDSKIASFALLIKMLATGGDTVREIRDYFKDVLTTGANEEFIERTLDAVDDLRDNLETEEIKSVTDLRNTIEASTPAIREINEAYIQIRNKQNRGKNVENFIGQIKDAKELFNDIRNGNGLTGNLNYSNFSKDQIREIRELLIQIRVYSEDLIGIYEDEL